MITRKMKALSIVLVIFFLAGCGQAQVKNEPPAAQKPAEQEWKTYSAPWMGWSFKYPADWPVGSESENGKGISLYIGDPEIDIRAWAQYYTPYDPVDTEPSLEDRLRSADSSFLVVNEVYRGGFTYGINSKDKIINVFTVRSDEYSNEGIEYTIYSEMTPEFYRENKDVIYKIAKSIKIFPPQN